MSKALDSGKSLAEAVLAKLPESLREQAKAALLAPEASEALTLLGDSALARSDYSRQMDEIRAKTEELKAQEDTLLADHKNLTDWYAEKKAVIDKYPSLSAIEQELAKARGGNVPPPVEPKPTVPGLTREEIDKLLMERDLGYADALALGIDVGAQHLHTFGEPPDMRSVIGLAKQKRISLEAAYQEKYGDKLAERAKADEAARIQKLVDEKYAEKLKQHADQPFPLRNREPSVLDVIADPNRKPSDYTAEAAAAEYERLQAART